MMEPARASVRLRARRLMSIAGCGEVGQVCGRPLAAPEESALTIPTEPGRVIDHDPHAKMRPRPMSVARRVVCAAIGAALAVAGAYAIRVLD